MNSSIPLLIVLLSSLSMASVNLIGTIVNKDNNHLLIGANVILVQDDKIHGTATDELGNFIIFSSYTFCFPVYRSELLYNSIFVLALSAPHHLL